MEEVGYHPHLKGKTLYKGNILSPTPQGVKTLYKGNRLSLTLQG